MWIIDMVMDRETDVRRLYALPYTVMKAKKSHYLPSASGATRKAGGII